MDTLNAILSLYADYILEYMARYNRSYTYAVDSAILTAYMSGVISREEAERCVDIFA